MTEKLIHTVCTTCDMIFAPFLQWERLRHPLAGWTRLVLVLLFPFIVWSHDWLLIGLLVMAVFSHPYWFPPYVDAGEDTHLLTQAVDLFQKWVEETPSAEKFRAFLPCTVLFFPLVGALWAHLAFWSMYFLVAVIGLKVFFFVRLFKENSGAA